MTERVLIIGAGAAGAAAAFEAADLVAVLSAAVRAGATVGPLRTAVYITPSYAEVFGSLQELK